jgi:hypothetical protein
LFNFKADQKTLTSQMLNPVGAHLNAPLEWATGRYAQAREWTQQRWTQLRDGTGAPTQEGGAMNVSVLPDTPESIGAQRRITLNPEPATAVADRPVIDPAITISPPDQPAPSGGPTADRQAAAPLALVGPRGITVPALPAGPTTPPGTPGYAWFRGGIPQPMPTTLAQALPPLSAEPTPANPAPQATRLPAPPPAQGDDLVDRAGFFQRRAAALRDEASSMRASTPAESDLLAAASRTYRALAIPGQINATATGQPPSSAPSGSTLRRPDFKALLSSAQWTHGMQRAKNLMAARGITTAPVLADAAVTTERIVVATDSQGRAVVRRKNDRGFGDSI